MFSPPIDYDYDELHVFFVFLKVRYFRIKKKKSVRRIKKNIFFIIQIDLSSLLFSNIFFEKQNLITNLS